MRIFRNNWLLNLKSSEDCNKSSMRLLYKCLIDGTAIIGKEKKQNRSLSERDAEMPLWEAGTFLPPINGKKVYETLLQAIPVLKITVLAMLFLILGLASESQAGDSAPTSGTCNETGTCLWSFADGKLSITAKNGATDVTMKNYADWNKADEDEDGDYFLEVPWIEHRKNITSVEIGDGIKNIGGGSFMGLTNLKTVTGMKDVATIEEESFNGAKSLENIEMPNVSLIKDHAFMGTYSLENIEMPSVTAIEEIAFEGSKLSSIDAPILAKIGDVVFDYRTMKYVNVPDYIKFCNDVNDENTCRDPLPQDFGLNYNDSCTVSNNRLICGTCNGFTKSGVGCVADCGEGYLGKNGRCILASEGCGSGYKNMGGWCNRVRYTPAEAAAVLKDDNNTVTITFKM